MYWKHDNASRKIRMSGREEPDDNHEIHNEHDNWGMSLVEKIFFDSINLVDADVNFRLNYNTSFNSVFYCISWKRSKLKFKLRGG